MPRGGGEHRAPPGHGQTVPGCEEADEIGAVIATTFTLIGFAHSLASGIAGKFFKQFIDGGAGGVCLASGGPCSRP